MKRLLATRIIAWFLGGLIGAFLGQAWAEYDNYQDIKEKWLTKSYNEGFEVGLCVAHRNFMKLDTADCFERELR